MFFEKFKKFVFVRVKKIQTNIPKKKSNKISLDKKIEIIKKLKDSGLTFEEIGTIFNITKSTAQQIYVIKYPGVRSVTIKKTCKHCGKGKNRNSSFSYNTRKKEYYDNCLECGKNFWSKMFRLKKCIICGSNKNKHLGFGLCSHCISVVRYFNKKQRKRLNREYYLKNRDKMIQVSKEYNQRPDVKEKRKVYSAKYYQNNKEKISERAKIYYRENKDRFNGYYKKSYVSKKAKLEK